MSEAGEVKARSGLMMLYVLPAYLNIRISEYAPGPALVKRDQCRQGAPRRWKNQSPHTSAVLTKPVWPSRCLTLTQPETGVGSASSSNTFLSALNTVALASSAAA